MSPRVQKFLEGITQPPKRILDAWAGEAKRSKLINEWTPSLMTDPICEQALVQYDGNVLAFGNNHLCHLNLENFLHRQTTLEEAQSDSRNFSGGKMDTKEVVHHPVNT